MRSLVVTEKVQQKLLRFGVIGVANTIIDFLVFAVAITMGVAPLIGNTLAWLVAVVFSYAANSRWTFERDPAVNTVHSVIRFVGLGALITIGMSSIVILALEGLVGALAAKIVSIPISASLNFLAARWAIEKRLAWH